MKQLYAGVLCARGAYMCAVAVMVCMTACAGQNVNPTISAIFSAWLKLRFEILNTKLPEAVQDSGFDGKIEDFRLILNLFSSSSVGSLYKINRSEHLQYLADIDAAAQRLKKALKESGGSEFFSIISEIDTNLDQLRLIEKNFSDNSQMILFMLFFFFSMFIIIIVLAFGSLYTRFGKMKIMQRQSAAFSRETIIAQEQERMRISRELHDTVAQDLWRLSFQTETMGKTEESAERSRLCKEIVKDQKELMRRVRSICDNLIPPDFQRRHLDDALHSLCYNFEQRTGIECQLVIQDKLLSASLDSDTQLQCFRIVQECLANVEKHAEASETSVLVRSGREGELVICVSDNGRGFSPPDKDMRLKLYADGQYGLWNIYERAASISAAVTFNSDKGEGTMVTLQVPLPPEGE